MLPPSRRSAPTAIEFRRSFHRDTSCEIENVAAIVEVINLDPIVNANRAGKNIPSTSLPDNLSITVQSRDFEFPMGYEIGGVQDWMNAKACGRIRFRRPDQIQIWEREASYVRSHREQ